MVTSCIVDLIVLYHIVYINVSLYIYLRTWRMDFVMSLSKMTDLMSGCREFNKRDFIIVWFSVDIEFRLLEVSKVFF